MRNMESIMEDLKPEAAYFVEDDGRRTGYIVVNIDDPSQIPAVVEPFFLGFNAEVRNPPGHDYRRPREGRSGHRERGKEVRLGRIAKKVSQL